MKERKIRYLVVCSSNTSPTENLTVTDISIRDRKKGYLAVKYHYVITRNGTVENGRSITDAGAYLDDEHPDIKNNNSIGVCLIGGGDENGQSSFNYTQTQVFSLTHLITELELEHPDLTALGLYDTTDMECKEPHFNVKEFTQNGK